MYALTVAGQKLVPCRRSKEHRSYLLTDTIVPRLTGLLHSTPVGPNIHTRVSTKNYRSAKSRCAALSDGCALLQGVTCSHRQWPTGNFFYPSPPNCPSPIIGWSVPPPGSTSGTTLGAVPVPFSRSVHPMLPTVNARSAAYTSLRMGSRPFRYRL